jgi:malonyl-CoA O-methyltransferase
MRLGWPPAGHELTDMHDWGDMLVQTGFAEPVMDMERIVLTWATPERRSKTAQLGRNLHPARFPGAARQGPGKALAGRGAARTGAVKREDGRIALTFEVIYGHAFKPAPRVALSAESAVSLREMRSMLQRGRPGP